MMKATLKRLPRMAMVIALLLTGLNILSSTVVSAQLTWGNDQIIDEDEGYHGVRPPRWPQVAISGSDVVAVWMQLDGRTRRVYSNHSTNGGADWGGHQIIDDNRFHESSIAQVAMSGPKAVVVWQQYVDGWKVFSSWSIDGGATWGTTTRIDNSEPYGVHQYAGEPQVAMDGSGVVAVFREWYADNAHRIFSNWSTDGGATWGDRQLIEDNPHVGIVPQVAMSGFNVVAVWHGWCPVNRGTNVFSSYSSDGGVSWGSHQNIGGRGFDAQVAVSDYSVVAVWRPRDSRNYSIYSNYSTDGGVTWGGRKLIVDNPGHEASAPQVAMSDSNAVVVWTQHDGQSSRVYANWSTDGGATWGDAQLIEDNAGHEASAPQVAMSDSNAVVVWTQHDGTSDRIYSNYASFFSASRCVESATGTGEVCFTTSDGVIEDLAAVLALSPAPRGVSFPHGMFEFSITGLADGATVTLTIELPEAVPDGFVWWKHDGTHWYSLPNLADNGDNVMVIELTDGGLGDTPGSPPGTITDPGGPGNPVPPLTVGWESSPTSKAAVMAPWIALLAAIAGASLLVLRRRQTQS